MFEDKTRTELSQAYVFNTKGTLEIKHEMLFNFYVTTLAALEIL